MKYAVVTGASRGIGRAVALRLANEYPVIINYHSNSESANEVKEQKYGRNGIDDASAS